MSTPLRVLLVEDQPNDVEVILDKLRLAGYEPIWQRVETESDYAALLDASLDVILAGFVSPQFGPLQALRLLQARGLDIPFIVVTGRMTDEAAVDCMKLGAADYLLKDRLARLGEAVNQALEQKRLRTERQQTRAALRRSEALNRAVLNSLAAHLAVLNRDGVIIAVNDAWSRFAAENGDPTTAHTGVGTNYLEICQRAAQAGDPIAADALMGIQAVLDGSQGDFTLEYPCDSPAEKRWFVMSVSPLVDDSGGVTISHSNVTGRKLAEEELRMLHSAVEQSASSVIITDLQGRIEYVNPHFAELTGYMAEEVIGQNPRLLKSGETPPQVYKQLWETLTTGGEWRGELHNRKKNGELFWEWASISAIKNAQGRTTHFMAVKEDITERKHAQETMMQAELLRVELAKERELLDLKQRFVSMVSHDFRGPLTIITASHGLLTKYFDRLSPEQHRYHLHTIDTQVKHMVELLDDALALATTQAGKLAFNPAPLDLEAFCRDVFQQMQLTDTVGHEFIFMAEGNFAKVVMDEKILRHILINLLSNAIKYSPGGGEIRLALSLDERETTLRITDQGIGIPLEDQPRIFEAFHRAKNAKSIGGTGLGLAIVKSNVEAHGGTITFVSNPGDGTTFTVRLPVRV